MEGTVEQRVVVDPVLRQRLSFRRAVDEDGGEVLHIEVWVDPGGGVPPHIHPAMEERFDVLAGAPSFLAGRKWQTAGPGETVVVPPGTRHAYRNTGNEVAHIICHARPPSSLQGFLEDAAALGRAGKLTRHALPKSPSALLQAAVMAHHYRDMVVLGFPPLPPPAIQRLVIPALARLGERRGYRAGHFADSAPA
jgi:quercetin dioxygenase-like cupin family protein